MKKTRAGEMDGDLRPEYDLHELLRGGTRGKYAARYCAGTNLVLLDPDVARAFPDDAAVNEALRLVIQLTEIQHGEKETVAKTCQVNCGQSFRPRGEKRWFLLNRNAHSEGVWHKAHTHTPHTTFLALRLLSVVIDGLVCKNLFHWRAVGS